MMKVLKLRTYWDAGEAETISSFLEELRMAILMEYGDEIRQMHLELQREQKDAKPHQDIPDGFEDDLPF